MEPNDIDRNKGMKSSRIWPGFFLLIAGLLLLGYKMGAPIPGWIFTWPVLLMAIGLLVGFKSKFRNPGAFIMILIGSIFFMDQSVPGINFHNYIVPVILICIGILFIVRPRGSSHCGKWERKGRFVFVRRRDSFPAPIKDSPQPVGSTEVTDEGEYIDVQAVFGGVKRNIQSKNFKGGEIVSFMGGAEINFMQADLQQPVVLEVNNVFGGTKLIIPSNWDVKNEISAIFGGVEDKRAFNNGTPDPGKRIYIKGSCVFGGIEVTNY
ncbi:MAG: LiaF domain-containing protein [Ginsengibacter sp.]